MQFGFKITYNIPNKSKIMESARMSLSSLAIPDDIFDFFDKDANYFSQDFSKGEFAATFDIFSDTALDKLAKKLSPTDDILLKLRGENQTLTDDAATFDIFSDTALDKLAEKLSPKNDILVKLRGENQTLTDENSYLKDKLKEVLARVADKPISIELTNDDDNDNEPINLLGESDDDDDDDVICLDDSKDDDDDDDDDHDAPRKRDRETIDDSRGDSKKPYSPGCANQLCQSLEDNRSRPMKQKLAFKKSKGETVSTGIPSLKSTPPSGVLCSLCTDKWLGNGGYKPELHVETALQVYAVGSDGRRYLEDLRDQDQELFKEHCVFIRDSLRAGTDNQLPEEWSARGFVRRI